MSKCLHPRIIRTTLSVAPDSVVFDSSQNKFIKDGSFQSYIAVPCGKCINCLTNQARQKAGRFVAELDSFPNAVAVMVTLTFKGTPPLAKVKLSESDDFKKSHPENKYRYPAYECVQDFHKRLRKYGFDISFLVCEEVGDKGRLHFHDLLLIKNPEILQQLPSAHYYKSNFLTDRQSVLDWKYDILKSVVTSKKTSGNINIERPPTDLEIRLRAAIRYKFWKLGKATTDFIDHAGGAVRYCTSYASSYATQYAFDKGLPAPVFRSSRLAEKFYARSESSIGSGSLRTLPLGNNYSITMPRYRRAKYRMPDDRFSDLLKSVGSMFDQHNLTIKSKGSIVPCPLSSNELLDYFYSNYNSALQRTYYNQDMPDFDIPLSCYDTYINMLNSQNFYIYGKRNFKD